MLAQNFKTADDLGITDEQKDALIKTLVLLETEKLRHYNPEGEYISVTNDWFEAGIEPRFDGNFNLGTWASQQECGTVCCLGGTAEAISGVSFRGWMDSENCALRDLFAPYSISCERWRDITTSQAATALRSYLTTGKAQWKLAVSS